MVITRALCFSALICAALVPATAQGQTLARGLLVCELKASAGGAPVADAPFQHLNILLTGGPDEQQATDPVEVFDPGALLHGRPFTIFARTSDGFAGSTGRRGESDRMMLSLTPSPNGQAYDAGLGTFQPPAGAQITHVGFCIPYLNADAPARFAELRRETAP